eukprot:Pgem_evm2s16483
MEIKQSETHTKIHQQQYIQNVIKQLRIPINTKISTPMATTFVKLIKQSAHNNHHVSKRLLKLFLMYIGIIRYVETTRDHLFPVLPREATRTRNVIRQLNYTIHPVESCIAISPDGNTAVGLYVDDVYKC